MNLLHIDSSADTDADSVTRRLTALFATTWRAAHGTGRHRHRDLCAEPVPPLAAAQATLGRRVQRAGMVAPQKVSALVESPAEEREWALTLPLIEELRAADTLLLGVPMYNFAVPAALKAWIDRVTFPGAFTDPDTGESLLGELRVVAVMARGGGYGPGTPREHDDFQTPYLKAYFANLGVAPENLHLVAAELTMAPRMPHLAGFTSLAEDSLARARATVTSLAAA
ncbi:NAD(P)H dehydrogenase (quinone) [Streptomyces davaonensis JCM 4913]|uniref:FMN dependent NADH:quinone oxidoreductase n=1 Tax=Streptomyces davaonensis (strain DSM 101723 / JCM 4913 / KCC S-0913 / 768) TaxID=1214101 RepID=K4QYK0_STRDJ|nr:NAD(P)H-dependent oxidoreductase [Streptomyces davaonensis]CCK25449.1 NAD(P)H dehydrogenase (quinone) [Streptomyces davaonensis JCM 4913]